MSRAEVERAACEGKVPFGSYTDAERVRKLRARRRRQVYRCRFCSSFHIGTRKPRGARKRKRDDDDASAT